MKRFCSCIFAFAAIATLVAADGLDFSPGKGKLPDSWRSGQPDQWSVSQPNGTLIFRVDVLGKSTVAIDQRKLGKPVPPATAWRIAGKLRMPSPGASAYAGCGILLLNTADGKDGWEIAIRKNGSAILKDRGKNQIVAKGSDIGDPAAAPLSLEVVFGEGKIQLYCNGKIIFDQALNEGVAPEYFGISVVDAVCEIEDLSVTPVKMEQPVADKLTAQAVNVAPRMLASATREAVPGYPPALAADGRETTSYQSNAGDAFLELYSASPFPLRGIGIVFPDKKELIAKDFTIEVLTQKGWEKLTAFAGNVQQKVYFSPREPIAVSGVRYSREAGPDYLSGVAELAVYADRDIGPFPPFRNVAAEAHCETSHQRYRGGDVSKAVDADPDTVWVAGPSAHYFLTFGSPARVSMIELDFGTPERAAKSYLIQILKNGRWETAFSVDHNDETVRHHPFHPFELISGVRYIPREAGQASRTDLAEIKVFSCDAPGDAISPPAPPRQDKSQRPESPAAGIFLTDHWRNFYPFPEEYTDQVDGVVFYALWRDIEPEQGKFDWSQIDRVLDECRRHQQKVVLKLLAGNYCPEWIYRAGAPRVLESSPEGRVWAEKNPEKVKDYNPPCYWDERYLKFLRSAVGAMAERYDKDMALDAVQMTMAGTGEMGRFYCLPHELWVKAGYSDEGFAAAMIRLMDFYVEKFPLTFVVTQISYIASNGSATPALLVAKHAVEKKVIVEQCTLDQAMSSSISKYASSEGPTNFVEIYRYLRGKTTISGEMNAGFSYNQSAPLYVKYFPEVLFQSFANGLGLGFTRISVYPADVLHPRAREIVLWAHRRIGKDLADTPSAWLFLHADPAADPHVGLTMKTTLPEYPGLLGGRLCRRLSAGETAEFEIAPEFAARNPDGFLIRVVWFDQEGVAWSCRSEKQQLFKSVADGKNRWRESCFVFRPEKGENPEFSILSAAGANDLKLHFVEVFPRHSVPEKILP